MKIRFTVTLSDATIRAFAFEGLNSDDAIKRTLVEALQARIDDATDGAPDEDDDDDDEVSL